MLASMATKLVIKEGPLAGRTIELEGELLIGREGVDVTIEDSELSRRHAAVRPVEGGVEIEDLGSLNGTYVNGERIERVRRLVGGDSITVGRSVLQLESPRAPTTAPARVPQPQAAPAPAPAVASLVPTEPFGTYAAPVSAGRRGGIASRQLVPVLLSWAAVIGTAVGLALYFAER